MCEAKLLKKFKLKSQKNNVLKFKIHSKVLSVYSPTYFPCSLKGKKVQPTPMLILSSFLAQPFSRNIKPKKC
jgi:hypothetical protein